MLSNLLNLLVKSIWVPLGLLMHNLDATDSIYFRAVFVVLIHQGCLPLNIKELDYGMLRNLIDLLVKIVGVPPGLGILLHRRKDLYQTIIN
jgi:hypothetical protein